MNKEFNQFPDHTDRFELLRIMAQFVFSEMTLFALLPNLSKPTPSVIGFSGWPLAIVARWVKRIPFFSSTLPGSRGGALAHPGENY